MAKSQSKKTPELSIVIPVHNEAGNIGPLIDEVVDALGQKKTYEIIVVDDASYDDTRDHLADAQDRHGVLRVLKQTPRAGQSRALVNGIRAARGILIVTLDGDGQNDPADISALLNVHAETTSGDRPVMVVGHRKDRQDSNAKKYASWLARDIRRLLFNDDIPDTGCSLKVFPKAGFEALPAFDHMHRFLPVLWRNAGGLAVSHPVAHRHRAHGTSKYDVLGRTVAGLIDLFGVLWLSARTTRPSVREDARSGETSEALEKS